MTRTSFEDSNLKLSCLSELRPLLARVLAPAGGYRGYAPYYGLLGNNCLAGGKQTPVSPRSLNNLYSNCGELIFRYCQRKALN